MSLVRNEWFQYQHTCLRMRRNPLSATLFLFRRSHATRNEAAKRRRPVGKMENMASSNSNVKSRPPRHCLAHGPQELSTMRQSVWSMAVYVD